MKVCEFCGKESSDNTSLCPSCGANEFKYKCGNCGNVFDEGCFCPFCGVKAGEEPKKCLVCGNEYYSTACPDCGYRADGGNTTIVYNNSSAQNTGSKYLWLWILGWALMFPIPLSVLICRNKKLSIWLKVALVALSWVTYFLIGYSGSDA